MELHLQPVCVRACVCACVRACVCACVHVVAYDTPECGLFEYTIINNIFSKTHICMCACMCINVHVCVHMYA